MIYLLKNKLPFPLILLILLFLTTGVNAGSQSKELMTLEEIINWGLEHSLSIKKLEDNLESLERKKEMIKAGLNWKIDLNSNLQYGRFNFLTDDKRGQFQTTLEGSRSYLWGDFTLKPSLTFSESDLTNFDTENIKDNLSFKLLLNQNLYPDVPTKAEQEYYSADIAYEKALLNYYWQKDLKIIEWLEMYFNLTSLKEKLLVEDKNYQLAEDNLQIVLEEEKIGEAGEQKVLSAEISLKQAEIRFLQVKNSYEKQLLNFYKELNLPLDKKINFEADSIREILRVGLVEPEYREYLAELILENNPQIISHMLDKDLLIKQYQWSKKSNDPRLSLMGNLEFKEDDKLWSLGLNVNLPLTDGGEEKLTAESYHAQLEILEEEYQKLLKDLDIQLTGYLQQVTLSELNLEEKKLVLKRALLEEKSVITGYKLGTVTEREMESKIIEREFAEIELKSAEDALLIARLKLSHFVGLLDLFKGGH